MITADRLDQWKQWIGRQETRTETLDPGALRRFAAAIGEPLDVERHFPSLGHWAFFLPCAAPNALGEDGHPRRGGLLPPVDLPSRMFAGAEIRLREPLLPGTEARRVATLADVICKAGRSGDLVLLTIHLQIEQRGRECIREVQTIVYRDKQQGPAATPLHKAPATADAGMWQPREVDLFRFSAATFNSHRIHYDRAYAQTVEHYPDLVVHAPFTAAKLFALARSRLPAIDRFTFRALAPIFRGDCILLRQGGERSFEATRADGVIAMRASC